MSTIGQEIIDAMSTLIDSSLKNQQNVKVLECTIVGLIDASIGLYEVKYLKQSLNAYTNTISTQYNDGDKVYVLSQDGTLDGNLIIIGSSNPYASLYENDSSNIQYKKVGENVFISVDDISFCSYYNPEEKEVIFDKGAAFNTIFSHYLESYKNFCISMGVRTAIADPYQKLNGDYGIEITIPFVRQSEDKIEQIERTFLFNTEKMEGSPYNFEDKVIQNLYISFDDDLIYDNTREISIKAFCNGFNIDNTPNLPDDIFLSGIQLYPIELIDASAQAGYQLVLSATEGNYFNNQRFRSTKQITPMLFVNGREVNHTNLPCYWFVQDNSVGKGSPYYSPVGGYGWRCLNTFSSQESSDGTTIEQILDTNIYSITVRQDEVITSAKYKCVILYNETAITSSLLLENLDSDIEIKITATPNFILRDSLVTVTCEVTTFTDYAEDGSYLAYAWTRYNSAGDYLDNNFWHRGDKSRNNFVTILDEYTNKRKYSTDINFYGSIITDNINLINCSIFKVNSLGNSTLIGSTQTVVAIKASGDVSLSMLNSNKLYKYDSNGNSPMTLAYDGPLTSRISEINPLSFVLYKSNGEEFSAEEYDGCKVTWSLPKKSMMNFRINDYKKIDGIFVTEDDRYYYVSKQGKFDIDYSIASTYNYNNLNNNVILNIKLTNSTVAGNADIQFIKEGENGTNGTKFSTMITYNGVGYDRVDASGVRQKLQLIYIADGGSVTGWYIRPMNSDIIDITDYYNKYKFINFKPFGLEVYKDGVLVDNTTSYDIQWSIFDEASIKPFFTMSKDGILSLATNRINTWDDLSPENNKILVAQAKVKVTASSAEDADTCIYAYYPIELIRVEKQLFEKMGYFPLLNGGYGIVTYSADGSNPQWDNSNGAIFKVTSGIDNEDTTNRYRYEWQVSEKLSAKVENNMPMNCKIVPVAKYDDAKANNYVAVKMIPQALSEIIDKINAEKNTLNNDIEKSIKSISKNILITDCLNDLKSNILDILSWASLLDKKDYSTRASILNKIISLDTIKQQLEKVGIITSSYENLRLKIYNLISTVPTSFESLSQIDKETLVIVIPEGVDEVGYKQNIYEMIDAYNALTNEINSLVNSIENKNSLTTIYSKLLKFIEQKFTITYDDEGLVGEKIKKLYGITSPELNLKVKEYLSAIITSDIDVTDILINYCTDLNNRFDIWIDQIVLLIGSMSANDWNNLEIDKRIINTNNFKNIIIEPFINLLSIYFNCEDADLKLNPYMNFDDSDKLLIENAIADISLLEKAEKKIAIDGVGGTSIMFLKPIIFRLNTNESGWLNDWDGNKLYIDEDNQYIIAPQIGAGVKDENNKFTGITMGVKRQNNNEKSEIGLFGFSKGKQSIFLDAKTGKAQFGFSGAGQINIDPNDDIARLYSGNYYEWNSDGSVNYNKTTGKGMLIDLTTPEIRFGNNGFWVDKDGVMHAGGNDKALVVPDPAPGQYPENPEYGEDDLGIFFFNGIDKFYWDDSVNYYKATLTKNGFSSSEQPLVYTDSDGLYFYGPTTVYKNSDDIYQEDDLGNLIKYTVGPYVRDTKIEVDEVEMDCYYFYDDNDNINYYFYDKSIERYLIYVEGQFQCYYDEVGSNIYLEQNEGAFNYYYFDEGEKKYLEKKNSEFGGWRIGSDRIFSENHRMTLYSAYNSPGRGPAIYSGAGYNGEVTESKEKLLHNSFTSRKDGFYLGDEGLSIGKLVRATNDEFYLGDDSNGQKYFTASIDKNTNFGKVEVGLTKGQIETVSAKIDKCIYVSRDFKDDKPKNENLYSIHYINTRNQPYNEDYKKYDKYYLYSYDMVEEWTDVTVRYQSGIIKIGDVKDFYYVKNRYDRLWELGASKKEAFFYFNKIRKTDLDRTQFNIDMAMNDVDISADRDIHRVYLGSDGMLVSDKFKIDAAGNVAIGDIQNNVSWKFNTDRAGSRAFMYYSKGTEDNRYATLRIQGNNTAGTTYVGTDGIRVGHILKATLAEDATVGSPGTLEIGQLYGRHFQLGDISSEGGEIETFLTTTKENQGVDVWSNNTLRPGVGYKNMPHFDPDHAIEGEGKLAPRRAEMNVDRFYMESRMFQAGDAFYLDCVQPEDGKFICQINADRCFIGEEVEEKEEWHGKMYKKHAYISLIDFIKKYAGGGGNLPQAENYTF